MRLDRYTKIVLTVIACALCLLVWQIDSAIASPRSAIATGESVRILRELQELSQNELAKLTGIPQSTISAIENDRVRLGVESESVA